MQRPSQDVFVSLEFRVSGFYGFLGFRVEEGQRVLGGWVGLEFWGQGQPP